MAAVLRDVPLIDMQQVLGTRVPGLSVLSGHGAVGTGSAIRIRGASSLTLNNDALVFRTAFSGDHSPQELIRILGLSKT